MAVQDYKINYKSDFVLNINGDAGWAVPFCIKFWTGMPSQAYFVGFDGVKYVNCRVGDTPTQLMVMFDDHHLPIGPLRMQIAYHTTIEEFPGSVFDEVTNARDVIVTIDGTDYQVLLDFTGEDAPELEFDLPAYANEAERIQNELQRQQNEAARIAAELQREQATAAAVQGAENVNAQLNGTTLTVTNRNGVSTSVNTKGEQGEQGPVGPEGPQGEQGISIVSFTPKSETSTTLIYTVTFSDGHTQDVAIPKGAKGDTGATGPQGQKGDTGVSITAFTYASETETDMIYTVTFSDSTTQQVAIPKGAKGDTGPQGPAGPTGPQGPMGDVAVITPEQQAAFTMYSVPGQNTDGPMTQKAVTDNLVASSISYDNSASGLAADNVQGALDEVGGEMLKQSQIFYNKLSISSRTAGFFGPHKLGFQTGKKYKVVVTLQSTATDNVGFYLSEAATSNVNGISFISVPAGNVSASKIYNGDASHQYLYWWSGESVSNKFEISVYEIVEGALQDVYKNLDTTNIVSTNTININANQVQIHVNNLTNIVSGHLYKVKVSLPYAATSNVLINLSHKTGNRDRFLICQINEGETTSEFNFLSTDNTHVWLCTYSTQSISGVTVEFYDYSEFSAESITNLNDAIYGITNKYVFSVSADKNTLLYIDGLWDKEKLVLISIESDDITFGEAWFTMTYNGVEESGCLITHGIGDIGVYKFTDDCTHIKVWCSNVSGNGNLTIVIQDAGLDKKLPVRFGNISIIGDSYSTYKYWIPNNNPSWYCTNGIDGENAETNNVNSVMQTWWYKLCQELPATLLLNDSYSGAPICNYAYNADQTSKSFVTRMKSCLGEDKALLPKPDIIIIFGGINDDWGDSVVGSVKYGNWTTEDLNQVLPSVCYMFDYIKKWNPSSIIINVVNNGLDSSISDGMAAAAEHYNIYNLPLLGIGKTSQHPNISGMNAIKNQIISFIRKIIIGI